MVKKYYLYFPSHVHYALKCHSPVNVTLPQSHIISPTSNYFNLLEFPHLPFSSCTNIQYSYHVPSINILPGFYQDPCFRHLVPTFPNLSPVNYLDHPHFLGRPLPKRHCIFPVIYLDTTCLYTIYFLCPKDFHATFFLKMTLFFG